MGELTTLPNIAGKLEAQLHDVGIDPVTQFRETGARGAWLRILTRHPSACLMRLSAPEGALRGVRWHGLDDKTQKELKTFYDRHKKGARG